MGQVRAGEICLAQRGRVHHDPRPLLHPGLHLHLPLVRDGLLPRLDLAEKRRGRRLGGEHLAVGPVVREAVSAFGRADQGAAGLDDCGARGHPLHRLVQVLVEGKAGVRRDDDVELVLDRRHREELCRTTGGGVSREQVAGEDLDDALLAVEQHVEHEVDAGRGRNRADGVVHRVADGDAPRRVRIADPPRVVEHQGGLEAGEAGRIQLRAAAEPGEEVRLDEAGRDAHIRIDPLLVEPHRNVEDLAAPAQRRVVARVVVHDAHTLDHVGAEHRDDLVGRVRTVSAGGDEHDDVVGVDDPLELVEHGRDHHVPRLRSGAVTHRDRDGLSGLHALSERCADGRAAERREHGRTFVRDRVHLPRRHDDRAIGGHVDLHAGLPVRETHLHESRCRRR